MVITRSTRLTSSTRSCTSSEALAPVSSNVCSISPVRPSRPGVSLVEEAKLFLDRQPIDAAPMFRRRPQSGALPGNFEEGFALRVVYALTHEDGGDSGGGAFDRGHDPVCFITPGVQTSGLGWLVWVKVAGGRRAGSALSFPLRCLWKARLPAVHIGGAPCM